MYQLTGSQDKSWGTNDCYSNSDLSTTLLSMQCNIILNSVITRPNCITIRGYWISVRWHNVVQGNTLLNTAMQWLIWNIDQGNFRNIYELLFLRALKISTLFKDCIFQCMDKMFCVEFQWCHLKFHTNYLIHTLKDMYFNERWKFKSA